MERRTTGAGPKGGEVIAGLIIGAVLGGTLMTVIMGALAAGTIDGLRMELDRRPQPGPRFYGNTPEPDAAPDYDWSRP
jgi:hypothetical protein